MAPPSCCLLLLLVLSLTETNKILAASFSDNKNSHPNVVLIIADDLGYGDIGCFGNTSIRTPHIDKLASQGVKLTHSIAADTMCTPSRAAFLTGRYPIRSGMASSHFLRVFVFTTSTGGLPANETTFAEVAKKAGYQTAFLGKWHQGWSTDRSDPDHIHPLNQGFDYFYGIPLSNMPDFGQPSFPVLLHVIPDFTFQLLVACMIALISVICLMHTGYLRVWCGILLITVTGSVCGYFIFCVYNCTLLNSFMFRNYDIVEQPIHLSSVTQKLVKESDDFLKARKEDNTPFLLVMSWLHVHTALATAPQFSGQSSHGPYGDVVEEMDWGIGQLMEMLDRYGMTENTLVHFTSDHGGAPNLKDSKGRTVGGYNGPFSGRKAEGSTEGSFRVPSIFRWPAEFPAGTVVDEPVSMMDVFPTLAHLLPVPLSGSGLHGSQVIDGKSLVPLLKGQESISPHEFLFHYCQDQVHAMRYRPRMGKTVWKLMLREPDPKYPQMMYTCDRALHLDPPKLYDMTSDPTAMSPLDPKQHPGVVQIMLKALKDHSVSVAKMPSQFSWWRLLWLPWKQPCCNFPKCACEDEKFKGMFSN